MGGRASDQTVLTKRMMSLPLEKLEAEDGHDCCRHEGERGRGGSTRGSYSTVQTKIFPQLTGGEGGLRIGEALLGYAKVVGVLLVMLHDKIPHILRQRHPRAWAAAVNCASISFGMSNVTVMPSDYWKTSMDATRIPSAQFPQMKD